MIETVPTVRGRSLVGISKNATCVVHLSHSPPAEWTSIPVQVGCLFALCEAPTSLTHFFIHCFRNLLAVVLQKSACLGSALNEWNVHAKTSTLCKGAFLKCPLSRGRRRIIMLPPSTIVILSNQQIANDIWVLLSFFLLAFMLVMTSRTKWACLNLKLIWNTATAADKVPLRKAVPKSILFDRSWPKQVFQNTLQIQTFLVRTLSNLKIQRVERGCLRNSSKQLL